MWLFTQRGFYSIVEDRQKPGNLLVRSRHKKDLANLLPLVSVKGEPKWIIISTPDADYPYRLSLPRELVKHAAMQLAGEIDYGNFKDTIHKTPDQSGKNRAYMEIWAAMRRAQMNFPNGIDNLCDESEDQWSPARYDPMSDMENLRSEEVENAGRLR